MTITKNTKVTIGVGMIVSVVVGVWWAGRITERVNQKLAEVYTISAATESALREAIENPGHRVPDPRNPGDVIVVGRN